MKDVNFIEAISERDIDLLLLEELIVNDDFFAWFIGKVSDYKVIERLGVWHSVTDKRFGESDLALIFQTTDNEKVGLLIENKVDALAQKNQCARYEERGKIGIEQKFWHKYIVCLVAPKEYIASDIEAANYKKNVTYEEIHGWFENQKDTRSSYKARIINEAIEQNRRGYTITPDERVSDFWSKYYNFANLNFSSLEMAKPGPKPSESDWPDFRPKALKKKMAIIHKLSRGAVDLQIAGKGDSLDELSKIIAPIIDGEIELVKASKSAALRITVPVIDRFELFENQIEEAKAGFIAAMRLLEIGQELEKDDRLFK
jgi:hypothetical protein